MADIFDAVRNRSGSTGTGDVFDAVRNRQVVPGSNLTPQEYETFKAISPYSDPMKSVNAFTDKLRVQNEATAAERERRRIDNPIKRAVDWTNRNIVSPIARPVAEALERIQEPIFGKAPPTESPGNGVPDLLQIGRGIAKAADSVPLNIPGTKIDDSIANFVRGAGDTATLGMSSYLDRQLGHPEYAEGSEGTTAGKVGQIAGYLVPGSAAYKAVGELGRVVSPIARRAIRGAAAGGLAQVGIEAGEYATGKNDQTIGERALDIGLAGAIGGFADVVLPAIGQKLAGTKLGQAVRNYFSKPKPAEDIFANPSETTEAGAGLSPTIARLKRRPGLSAVIEKIRPAVTERITPPYENPNELAKWVRDRLNDSSVSLNEVRDLPYEDLRQLAEELRAAPNAMHDTAIQVAREQGFDLEKLLNPRKVEPDMLSRARERQYWRDVAGVSSPVRTARRVESPTPPETLASTPAAESPVIRPEPVATSEPTQTFRPEDYGLTREDIPFDFEGPPTAPSDDLFGSLNEPDALLPDDSEVAPMIRSKLHNFADKLIEDAKKELTASRNRLSSNPVDVYAQFAKLGAGYVLKGVAKSADFFAIMMREHGDALRREFNTTDTKELKKHVSEIFKQSKQVEKSYRSVIEREHMGLDQMPIGQELDDAGILNLASGDVYQNFKKVFGDHYESIKKNVLDPFDRAKAANVEEQTKLLDKLHDEIVVKLGIKRGSKESELVQKYGEGQIDHAQLVQEAPTKWKDIERANDWFRDQYNELIDRVNVTIKEIYPNSFEKHMVPKRKNYFHHFREMGALQGFADLLDTAGSKIDPRLAGISQDTKPKTKWAAFKQQRGLGEFTNDAVGGFLKYIPAASHAIHIDPQISVFRNLARHIGEDTATTRNLNNFKEYLEDFANDLSGKTNPFDRSVQKVLGRQLFRVVSAINRRISKNTLLGSAQTMLAQLGSLPQGLSNMGPQNIIPAAKATIQSALRQNQAMARSQFMRERYLQREVRKFDRWWEKPESTAAAMMEAFDRVGTSMTWNGAYLKAAKAGVKDPVKVADEETRRLIGGTGVGEVPVLFRSQTMRFFLPFQRDLNATWRALKLHVDSKEFGALAMYAIYSWILNEGISHVTGRRPFFDPVNAAVDAFGSDKNAAERGGRLAGEVLSNLPGGQLLAGLYPESGVHSAFGDLPSRENLFGEVDPTRFGEVGLLPTTIKSAIGQDVTDPLFKLALPFGGSQLKRSIQGVDALARGGAYTDNAITTGQTIESPRLRFPVAASPMNIARASLFGPYATTEGKQYTDENRTPLSERQTRIYQNTPDPRAYYNALQEIRKRKAASK